MSSFTGTGRSDLGDGLVPFFQSRRGQNYGGHFKVELVEFHGVGRLSLVMKEILDRDLVRASSLPRDLR